MSEPITREEMYLAALGGEAVTLPDPLTREELYLAYLNGMTDTYPDPITRTEQYLYKLCQNGMGGGGGSGGGGDSGALQAITGRTVTGKLKNSDITHLGRYALASMTGMESVDLPNVTVAEGGCFMDCTNLKEVNLPELTTFSNGLSAYAGDNFKNCSSLKKLILPKATSCPGLGGTCAVETLYLPMSGAIGYAAYKGNSNLKTIIVGNGKDAATGTIAAHSIVNCGNLKVLGVAYSKCVALQTILNGTPFAEGGTGGYVLAPSDLIEEYRAATNWSVHYAYGTMTFLPWEDFTIDGTVTGAPDWDKVNELFE